MAYDDAKRIYDRLIAEKTAKGYTPGEDGTPYQGTEKANQTTGIHCQLLNPVEETEAERLIADPAYWMQEKYDGRRLLIDKRGERIAGINRLGLTVDEEAAVDAAARLLVPPGQVVAVGVPIFRDGMPVSAMKPPSYT